MKLYRYIILIAILLTMTGITAYSQETSEEKVLPESVRVGLYYLTSAVNSVELSSNSGFIIGYSNDEDFKKITSNTLDKIKVIKDNYSLDSNKPAYHINVESAYSTYSQANNAAVELVKAKYNAFPVYEDGWKVFIGVYSSKTSANTELIKLKKVFTKRTFTVVEPNESRIRVEDKSGKVLLIFGDKTLVLEVMPTPANGLSIIGVNDKRYRGSIRILRKQKSDMTVVNVLPFEEYLYSVVTSEMPSGWNIEALKAQTLAARTYAVFSLKNSVRSREIYKPIGFDMTNTVEFQVYKGFSEECEASRKAVNETKGQIIYYNNQPINAVFFSSDGGYTEDSENVWNEKLPYLRAVQDKYLPSEYSNKNWTFSVTAQEIKDFYKTKNIDIGDIVDIHAEKYSKSRNVILLKVIGTIGEWKYEKGDVRAFLGGNKLYSQNFIIIKNGSSSAFKSISAKLKQKEITLEGQKVLTKSGSTVLNTSKPVYVKDKNKIKKVESQPKAFVFEGSGWGHAVGLSQWGAKGMADKGFKYDQIIKHYYTGTEIK